MCVPNSVRYMIVFSIFGREFEIYLFLKQLLSRKLVFEAEKDLPTFHQRLSKPTIKLFNSNNWSCTGTYRNPL